MYPNVNYGFGEIMIYQYSIITALMMIVGPSIVRNVTILLQDVHSERGCALFLWGQRVYGTLYFLINFAFNLKLL